MIYYIDFLIRHLQKIKEIQEFFVQAGAIEKALLHLDSSSEAVVREVFAFLAVVLYEGNRKVQVSVELP